MNSNHAAVVADVAADSVVEVEGMNIVTTA